MTTRLQLADAVGDLFQYGPATHDELVAYARDGGASEHVIASLQRLPDRSFKDLRELWLHLPDLPTASDVAREFSCPACGEHEALHGSPGPDGIELTCSTCGHTWPRDETPRCATCGSADVRHTYRSVLALGRASVTSQVGRQPTLVCEHCDAPAIARWTDHGHPLPPHHVPAATSPDHSR
ncbi:MULTISPECIES: DUF2795 domain-containing protein [Cellulosimicrobium]|uniref:DUF2795 domain-containing protein n=1 Tax=Cellulosimicrobium TaxID=157920 RepID=UPI001BA9E6D5|nr:DUF2795 domain-containing protein [Cellulosimicrobium cellulans]QUC01954.1 DUF2795 domain-containing protein [Cellulosimicrobium cellulans]